jgi:hypothetical protein
MNTLTQVHSEGGCLCRLPVVRELAVSVVGCQRDHEALVVPAGKLITGTGNSTDTGNSRIGISPLLAGCRS